MKDTKDKFAFFRFIFRLVTENWGLKILALVLAVVIYYTMKPTNGALQKTKFERTDEHIHFEQP